MLNAELLDEVQNRGWELWDGQDILIEDFDHRELVLMTGMGYGKSTFGARWHLSRVLINDESPSSIVLAPDYKLAKNVNMELYIAELEYFGLREGRDFRVHVQDLILEHLWGVHHRIIFLSAEKPRKIMAWTASHLWIDEAARMKKEAVMQAAGRLRCKRAKLLQAFYSYVPEGDRYPNEKFSADKFERQGKISQNETAVILHGSSYDNPVLPEEFFAFIEDAFGWDPAIRSNYIDGVPASMAQNRFYYGFDARRNTKAIPIDMESRRLILTLDFNVGMMSWAAMQELYLPEFTRPVYAVHKANRSDANDLEIVADQVLEAFPKGEFGRWVIECYGDARGHNRSDQTSITGYDYLTTLLKPHYPLFKVLAHRSNPSPNERMLCTNRLFKEGRLLINPKCTKVIESAKMAESDGKGGIKKPPGEKVTHPMEAVDMALMELSPPPVRLGKSGFNRYG